MHTNRASENDWLARAAYPAPMLSLLGSLGYYLPDRASEEK